MELKRCTKCGENKPNTNEYFVYNNKSKGKLKAWCKVCDREYAKEYREKNKDIIKELNKKYYELNKEHFKEYSKKYRELNIDRLRDHNKEYREKNKDKISTQRKEYRDNNKDKIRESQKNYRENNKDKLKEYRKEYYKNNKDKLKEYYKNNEEIIRAKRKVYIKNNRDKFKLYQQKRRALKLGNGGSYTEEQWLDTLEYFDYKCAYTGECIKVSCHIDHIIPLSKGGTSYIWNLVPSTASANLSKQSRNMEEWYREQEYFCEERLNKIYEYQKNMAAKYK